MNGAAPGGRRVAASSALIMGESVLRLGITALMSFWVAHALGPAQFGVLNAASALMAIFVGITTLGLEVPLVLRLVQDDRPGATLGSALALRLPAALLGTLATCAIALVLYRDDPQALAITLIVSLAVVGYAPSLFDCWFRARVQALPPAAVRLGATIASALAKAACLCAGLGLEALAWTVAFESAASAALVGYVWWKLAKPRMSDPLRVDPPLVRALWHESRPYLGGQAATMVAMKIDVVLLGALAMHEQAGLYSLSQKLAEVLYIVPVALADSALPLFARRAAERRGSADAQTLFDLCTASSIVAAAIGVVLAGPAIGHVFGDAYAPTLPLFALHAWTVVAIGLTTARLRWLAVMQLQRHAPSLAIGTGLCGIVLNLLLIPRYGAMGAVWSSLLSQFIGAIGLSLLVPELRPIARLQLRSLWPWGRLFALAPAFWRRWA